MNVGANEMVQHAKALAGRLNDLSWILKTRRNAPTPKGYLLTSTNMLSHSHTCIHIHIIIIKKKIGQ